MDIPRGKEVLRRRTIKRILLIVAGVVAVSGAVFGLNRLKPAAPSVDASTVWKDTVKRGPMIRQVRGLGRLTPEEIVWIPAAFDCSVEKIAHEPEPS